MANIKSAKKRINTIERRRQENKFIKSTMSTYVKNFNKMIADGEIDKAETALRNIVSYINSACSKGVLHKNNASRKIGRLTANLYKAKLSNVKNEVKETPKVEKVEKVETVEVKEEPVKKVCTKKTTTKKATAEPKTAKKTTTKKTTK